MTEDGLTVTIALALSEVTNIKATEVIGDFSEYADPDALNAMFRVKKGEEPRDTGHLHLNIRGYDVIVHSDGDIKIEV